MMLSPLRGLHPVQQVLRRRFGGTGASSGNTAIARYLSSSAGTSKGVTGSSDSKAPGDYHGDAAVGGVGLYNMPAGHHHDDPRKHLNPDGTYQYPMTPHIFHYEDVYSNVPKQQVVSVGGQKMIKGVETRDLTELFQIHQKNIPFFPRRRVDVYGSHDLLMKAEFLFFWTPTFIIWSLTVPAFTLLYMADEAIFSAMTVKVIGRQWYWIYEVESPVDE